MIKLFYKEIELGSLTYDKKTEEYVYNSNLAGEKSAKEKYSAYEFYYLSDSVNKRSKTLFNDFSIFTGCFSRKDIIQAAKISKNDTDFEKLKKLAKIDLFNDDYYIKSED